MTLATIQELNDLSNTEDILPQSQGPGVPEFKFQQEANMLESELRFYVVNLHAEIATLRTQLEKVKAGWDSCIADLRKAAEICREAEAGVYGRGWNDAIEAGIEICRKLRDGEFGRDYMESSDCMEDYLIDKFRDLVNSSGASHTSAKKGE